MTAWCRPEYLRPVLASHAAADLPGVDRFFFVDGPIPGDTDEHRARIDESEALCRAAGGEVFRRERNVGVAHQIFESKRLLFGERGHDVVISCVDDVLIAPYAVPAVLALRDRLKGTRATADIYNTTLATPKEKAGRLGNIMVNGDMVFCAMGKAEWDSIRPTYAEYIRRFIQPLRDAGLARPYRHRPHGPIREWLAELNGGSIAATYPTSQDGCVCMALKAQGIVTYSTVVNHCMNIGVLGEHCNPRVFKKIKLDKVSLDLFPQDDVLRAIRGARHEHDAIARDIQVHYYRTIREAMASGDGSWVQKVAPGVAEFLLLGGPGSITDE